MSQIVFLLDACVPELVTNAVLRLEPSAEIHHVGEEGTPPRSAKDPEILDFAGANGMMFVTFDKRTMPGHLAHHFAAGKHTHGVLLVRSRHIPPRQLAEDLVLIWTCHSAEDWVDQTSYLPL
jgi:predicted nuclease of predicted toxin-antitoxin system